MRGFPCSLSPSANGRSFAQWADCKPYRCLAPDGKGSTSMKFGNINYFAVLMAAAVAWLAGAAWYRAFGRTWMAAQGMTVESVRAARHDHSAYLPFIVAFVAELVMAWTLAGILFHVGSITVRRGIIAGALCWFGFVLTTMLVNNTFER